MHALQLLFNTLFYYRNNKEKLTGDWVPLKSPDWETPISWKTLLRNKQTQMWIYDNELLAIGHHEISMFGTEE